MDNQSHDIGQRVLAAIDEGSIEVFYQPQMTANGETIAGVEALVRWRNKDGESISPADFIPAVEKLPDVIGVLGQFVLRRACEDARKWPDLMIAVNVAPIQFTSTGFVESVQQIILETGLPPERLELEILESSWFEDPAKAVQIIQQLRALGISIAMDDFGTGYASLGALMQLPLDKLKIDKSFVTNVQELRPASIVHSIVALARSIGLRVTAEGVETRDQHRFLRSAGCHYLQGHYFSEAVPAAAISDLLAGSDSADRHA